MSYINLHTHTEYSNLRLPDCINKVSTVIDYAKKIGLNGIAITDHESLSGHVKAIQHYKQRCQEDESWKDFKLMLGNEIYLTANGLNSENVIKGQKYPHFILVALDEQGHQQLRELSSRAWSHSFKLFLTRVPTYYKDIEEVIGKDPGHIAATSACIGGQLGLHFLRNEIDQAKNFIKWCKDIFGDLFFLELQPALYQEQIRYNTWLVEIARETNTKITIATDAHYLNKEKQEVHAAFLSSKDGERETKDFYQYTYIMTPEEIYENMSYLDKNIIDEAFENTNYIGSLLSPYSLKSEQKIPRLNEDRGNFLTKVKKLPGFGKKYIDLYIKSPHEDDQYIIYLALKQLYKIIPDEDIEMTLNRLNQELEECWEISEKVGQRISTYMLTVRNIINRIWTECDSLVGVARGSAGGFVLNYLIGITQMNPLKQGVEIPHWRFIHKDRPEYPDIDLDSEGGKRPQIIEMIKRAAAESQGTALNICTFGTEGTRSAILTAARGLKIDVDIAQYLTTMIPQERGFLWSLSDCINGNPEKDRKPIPVLIAEFNKYPMFLETAQEIEGLVSRVGIHACGINIFNQPVHYNNAMMKAPNGLEITQFDLNDSDYLGGMKFDLLSVEALDKIHKTMDLLMEDKIIEWQGTLKATYEKYLSPDVLEYNAKDMWKLLWDNKLIDGFQMDSTVARQAIDKIRPTSIPELTSANSLMRLMPERGHEMPVDTYAKNKNNIQLWYDEMYNANLNAEEITLMRKYLDCVYGVANTQEEIMLLTLDPKISNFTIQEANKLRKAVAKKKPKVMAEVKEMFYKKGIEAGTRKELLDYVWNVQIMKQAGYSFSIIHSTAYSIIGLQELNLLYKYHPIYWATACLTVNSGGADEETGGTTNYGKLSASIGRIKNQNIDVKLPDINGATFGFKPDTETNSIIFGMKGMANVGDDLIAKIIENRPYTSFADFYEKVSPSQSQTISLIKAGCFDELEKPKLRRELLYSYIEMITPKKSRITLQNFSSLVKYNLIPKNKEKYIFLYNFNKYTKTLTKGEKIFLDERAYQYYTKRYDTSLIGIDGNKEYIYAKAWEKIYTKEMDTIREWLSDNRDRLINKLHSEEIQEIWNNYCMGTASAWEMETLGFYYHDHELINAKHGEFNFKNFFELPEEPKAAKFVKTKNGDSIPIFELHSICGTVLDKSSYKRTVTIATVDGVVTVKCAGEQFGKYNKQLSMFNEETGRKEIIERSWFKRGTMLIVNGWRSRDQFMARSRQSEQKHSFYKIIGVDDLGNLEITRYRADDNE